MKLKSLHEQVAGHWRTIYHPGHMDPKMRKSKNKQDLSFRLKGKKKISKGPRGGSDGIAEKRGIGPDDVDPKELEMGIEIELEHTSDRETAKRIALDHLAEIEDYYTRLKKMEAEPQGGSDRLAGKPGEIPGGELKACQDRTSRGIKIRYQ